MEITKKEIMVAAKALLEENRTPIGFGLPWDEMTEGARKPWIRLATTALQAAASV